MATKKEIVTKFKQEKLDKGKFTFKIESREEQSYTNNKTFYGTSINNIPRENLFISESNHFFDVKEMVENNENFLINQWTNEPFTHNDMIKLRKYALVGNQFNHFIKEIESDFLLKNLSPATLDQMNHFYNTINKNSALSLFQEYYQTRMPESDKSILHQENTVMKFLALNGLSRFEDIFSQKIDLTPLSENFKNIIDKLNQYHQYKNIIAQPQEITRELETTQRISR